MRGFKPLKQFLFHCPTMCCDHLAKMAQALVTSGFAVISHHAPHISVATHLRYILLSSDSHQNYSNAMESNVVGGREGVYSSY